MRGSLRILGMLMAVASGCLAAPVRVVTFNIGANWMDGSLSESLNEPGTTDYDSVRDILARIDADVVCLQELANADVAGGTNGGTSSDVHSLAADLGLPYVMIPTNYGAFDFTLRNVILSRYPFLAEAEIGSADYMEAIGAVGDDGERAKEVTRVMPAVEVDVPGTAAPLVVVTLHAKSASGNADKFRRAVEFDRLGNFLSLGGYGATDNVVVVGDFNLSGTEATYAAEPSGLPSTWNRGTDIPLPVTYSTDPDFYYATGYGLTAIDALALDGSGDTSEYGTIDFVLATPAAVLAGAEIYRSELDTSNDVGLAKAGDPPGESWSADASDHYAVFADLELADAVTSYGLSDSVTEVVEGFDGFGGAGDPPVWTVENADWLGVYGGGTEVGTYAFDDGGNRSVGLVPGETEVVFSAEYENRGTAAIPAVEISYLATQFAADAGGTEDSLSVAIQVDGGELLEIPALGFTASADAVVPVSASLSATVSGLDLAAGSSFRLYLTGAKGESSGESPDDVFINEIHYDNESTDVGEFVEVVVGPGFAGDDSGISLWRYNGGDGGLTGGELVLTGADNYGSPGTSNGYRIYHFSIAGIQNGAPDGLALTVDGSVVEFISYEGSFEATEGPAAGMTSVDVGVEQGASTPAGYAAIGRTGAGAEPADFSWVEFGGEVAHSPGEVNAGQVLTGVPVQVSQAISLDDVTVTVVAAEPDHDGDGIPDDEDADDDNDGLSDVAEVALGTNPLDADSDGDGVTDGDEDFDGDGQSNASELLVTLTDPLDGNSRFAAEITAAGGGDLMLVFPTIAGRVYDVWAGAALDGFAFHSRHSGDGDAAVVEIVPVGGSRFFRVSARLDE